MGLSSASYYCACAKQPHPSQAHRKARSLVLQTGSLSISPVTNYFACLSLEYLGLARFSSDMEDNSDDEFTDLTQTTTLAGDGSQEGPQTSGIF